MIRSIHWVTPLLNWTETDVSFRLLFFNQLLMDIAHGLPEQDEGRAY